MWVIARQHPGETMAEFFAEVGPATHSFARCLCAGLMQIAMHAHACAYTCFQSCLCAQLHMLPRLAIASMRACHCCLLCHNLAQCSLQ